MAIQIKKIDIIKELTDITGAQPSDNVPNIVAGNIVPVLDVNPAHSRRANICRRASLTNATSGAIYTTPINQDFYLSTIQMSVLKDVTATSTATYVQGLIGGATQIFCEIKGLTLTVQADTVSITFNNPILIDKNTNITLNHTTNVGNVTGSACISGYTVEK